MGELYAVISARQGLAFGLLLAAALGVRLAAAAVWQARQPPAAPLAFPDSETYLELARTISRGEPYAFGANGARVFRAPGYPLLLAPLFAVYGGEPPIFVLRALGAVLGTAAVGLLMIAGWRLGGFLCAMAAGTIAALQPECIAASVFLLSEAPFAPWLVLQLLLTTEALLATSLPRARTWGVLAGAAAGVAVLIRPSWILFLPCWGLALWISALIRKPASPASAASTAMLSAAMLFGCAAVLLPWWIRNYAVTGTFVPTTLQTGASLYDGLNPNATGASDMRFVPEFEAQLQAENGGRLPENWELELDTRLRQAAVAWAAEHPARALQLAAIKFARMWSPFPNAQEFRGVGFSLLLAAGYLPLAAFAALGCWKLRSHGTWLFLWLAPLVYLAVLHAVFIGSIRYRQPALLALALVAAAGVPGVRLREPVAPSSGLPGGPRP